MAQDVSGEFIRRQEEWAKVAFALAGEKLKVASYDNTIVPALGDIKGRTILDYGSGPGVLASGLRVLASGLRRLGADVKAFDISEEFRQQAGDIIGHENVYATATDIPLDHFDFVVCNLVLCIVEEPEVRNIALNIVSAMKHKGFTYIGFCNPKIFDVRESNLDLRPEPQAGYSVNHDYTKTKKEGGYQIVERHRPLEWYSAVFKEAGLQERQVIYTPEYELNNVRIKDFSIFELSK